jgi:hypothetical protein
VFDGQNDESFAQIALQGDTMKERGIVRGWICRGVVKGREVVFEPTPDPPTHILERLVDIVDEVSFDRGQAGTLLAPNPQSVTLVSVGQALVDQLSVEKSRRQASKANHQEMKS